jgi:transposase-like protein
LREIIDFTARHLMESEVEALTGAAYGEKSQEPLIQRNDYYAFRSFAKAVIFPGFLEPRRLAEKPLMGVVQEAYVPGVSTPLGDDLVKAMGMTSISKSQVSRLCAEIDERVKAFLSRRADGRRRGRCPTVRREIKVCL